MSAIPIPSLIARSVATVARPSLGSLDVTLRAVEAAAHRWLIAHSIAILRVSIGAILLGFGVLKFFPGVSPAQGLVEKTTSMLTFGLIPGAIALVLVALLETVVGLWLISGRGMRGAVYLLGAQLVGIMSPLVLLPGTAVRRPARRAHARGPVRPQGRDHRRRRARAGRDAQRRSALRRPRRAPRLIAARGAGHSPGPAAGRSSDSRDGG